jgi:hypothetical protein
MPHFRLIDEKKLGPSLFLLMRARLHIRGGKRRLQKGHVSLGLITLYDALISAMEWYIMLPEHKEKLRVSENDNLKDDNCIFDVLVRSGVIDGRFSYDDFNRLVDRALKDELSSFDYSDVVRNVESVMHQLGVMPFDEHQLPPDNSV